MNQALGRAGQMAAALVGLTLVLVLTLWAFRLPIADSLNLLAQGAFGDRFGLARTLVKACPLLLAGLGMVFAWRAGVYNIGGEGQFVLGGIFGGWVAKLGLSLWQGVPSLALTTGILLAAALGGALWSAIAGWLYVKRGVEVVIGTILLNFIALQLLGWMVSGPLQERQARLPQSDLLPSAAMLTRFDRQSDLHVGVFLALAAAIASAVFLFRTRPGFELRVVGESAGVARANRISKNRMQMLAMLLSGGLCGLAGGVEYVGVQGQLSGGFAQGWGFLAIPVALLGGLNPLIVILSAVYFGALFAGSENLGRFTVSGATLVYVIQAAAVLGFVAIRAYRQRRPLKMEAS